jgi:Protein of unknown function (DUF4230)
MRHYDYHRQDRFSAQASAPAPRLHLGWIFSLFKGLSLMATGGFVMLAFVAGFGVWRTGDRFLSTITGAFTQPQPEPEVDVRSLVLEQVRGASELTTAVFNMQAVVPTSRDRVLGGYVIGKTTLLYIAYGEVRAGVDLSELSAANVEVVNDVVRLRLPAPRILDSKVDVTRSTVYDYDRGFLGMGPDAAPDLQTLAQQETLQQIVQTACTQGILQQANDRAEAVVTQLLSTAGHKQFVVETQAASTEACATAAATPAAPPTAPSLALPGGIPTDSVPTERIPIEGNQ